MDERVGGEEGEAVVDGVGDEEAVEGIAMECGEFFEGVDGVVVEAMVVESKRGDGGGDGDARWLRQGEFAEAVFDLDFPRGCLVQTKGVGGIFQHVAYFVRKPMLFVGHPKESAGVEEEGHEGGKWRMEF